MKYLIRFGLFAGFVLSGLLLIGYYWTFVRLAPDYTTPVSFEGLEKDVVVKRDQWAVPEIQAETEADLFFALGAIHAQERLWQMTISQLTVDGRFSAHFGPDLLPTDRFLLTLDFASVGRKNLDLLPADEKNILLAYANGVNAWVDAHRETLPIEFALAGISPIRWEPYHSLGIARLMAWQLNVTWTAELAYALLQQRVSPEEFELIRPESWPDRYVSEQSADSTTTAGLFLDFIKADRGLRKMLSAEGSHVGSNAWAVSGKKTASGKAMLSGDPHLGLAVPGVWYEVSLRSPTIELSGVSIPGVPGVVLGQNRTFAWSFTNVMADDADFFIEKVHPGDSSRYLADVNGSDSTWKSFEMSAHYIEVKGEAPRPFLVKKTQNGPVINAIYSEVKLPERPLLSMSWTGSLPSAEFSAILGSNRAKTTSEFKQALRAYKVPSQNCIFADSSGFIAQWTIGRIPETDPTDPLIRSGWIQTHRWSRFLEFDELPSIEVPESGFVLSANNPIGDGSRYLSRYWEPPSRYVRLLQLLENDSLLTPAAMQAAAFDTRSPHAAFFLSKVLPTMATQPNRSSVQRTYSYLFNWDFDYQIASTAASIFDVFFIEFTRLTLQDQFGKEVFTLFTDLENVPVRAMHEIIRQDSLFYDIKETPEIETRDSLIFRALDRAVAYLDKNLGPEPHQWRWENLHTLTLSPLLFGKAAEAENAPAALKLIVNAFLNVGPNPTPGNGMTVNNGQYDWEKPFRQVLGASVRRTIDFADRSKSWSVLPAGQSGNPLSRHYSDQTALWLSGKTRTFSSPLPDSLTRFKTTFFAE